MKKTILSILSFKPVNIFALFFANILNSLTGKKRGNIFQKFPVNKTYKVKLGKNESFLIHSNGHDIIAKEIYWTGVEAYEPDTMKLFVDLARRSNCLLDIGANIGVFSLVASCINGNGKLSVHSFEPINSVYEQLALNKEVNNFGNLYVNNIALSNIEGELIFYIPITPDEFYLPLGSSSRTDHLTELRRIENKVMATTLDNYVKANNLNKIDFIKIDTEGTEHLVFEGGLDSLHKFKPVIISEVLDGLNEPLIQGILDKFDYKYFSITNRGLVHKTNIKGDSHSPFKNYLFIQENDIPDLLSSYRLIYQ